MALILSIHSLRAKRFHLDRPASQNCPISFYHALSPPVASTVVTISCQLFPEYCLDTFFSLEYAPNMDNERRGLGFHSLPTVRSLPHLRPPSFPLYKSPKSACVAVS